MGLWNVHYQVKIYKKGSQTKEAFICPGENENYGNIIKVNLPGFDTASENREQLEDEIKFFIYENDKDISKAEIEDKEKVNNYEVVLFDFYLVDEE